MKIQLRNGVFDAESAQLRSPSAAVPLTRAETRFLSLLFQSVDGAMSRDALCRGMNHRVLSAQSRALDMIASSVRSKLRTAGIVGNVAAIRNYGYMYEGEFEVEPVLIGLDGLR